MLVLAIVLRYLAVVWCESVPELSSECAISGKAGDTACPVKSGSALIQQNAKTETAKHYSNSEDIQELSLHPSRMILQFDKNAQVPWRSPSVVIESDAMDSRKSLDAALAQAQTEGTDDKPAPKKGAEPAPMSTILRPNFGKQADIIDVGILVKKFMGVMFSEHTFEVDAVIIAKWVDKRASKLLKKGAESLSLNSEEARRVLWLPDILISNRVHEGFDILSSGVQVKSNGTVIKVDRCHVTLQCNYKTNAFPFDTQTLPIKIASSTLMVDQLILRMDAASSGVGDEAFEDNSFNYIMSSVDEYEERDGPLEKSRAKLDIVVKRKSASCVSTVLIPCLCIASISWSGFFMPCHLPAFMMPRVATSFVSFLMQVTLDAKIDAIQPERNSDSWLDILHASLEACVYTAVIFNIIVQYTAYWEKLKNLGRVFDEELQLGLPVVTTLLVVVCMAFIGVDENVHELLYFTRAILIFTVLPYMASMLIRIRIHAHRYHEEEAAKKLAGVVASELPPFKPAPAPVVVQGISTPMIQPATVPAVVQGESTPLVAQSVPMPTQ